MYSKPVPMPIAPAMPPTPTRSDESFSVPSPSWPKLFRPVHCTDWSERSTHVCQPPADTAVGVIPPSAANWSVSPTGIVELAGIIRMVEAARSPNASDRTTLMSAMGISFELRFFMV